MFMRDHVADFPIQIMCETPGVSRSGYYAWASRDGSARAAADRALAAEIRAAHAASRGRYGSPRVHAELRARGRRVGRKRVARLMRRMGLAARHRRRSRRATDSSRAFPIAPNLLGRKFTVEAPDRVWLADRGVQFAAHRYRARLLAHGMLCSMTCEGDCWDNAPMESFFATQKGETVEEADYQTRAQARVDVLHHIEGFYNKRRLHSALGYITPEH